MKAYLSLLDEPGMLSWNQTSKPKMSQQVRPSQNHLFQLKAMYTFLKSDIHTKDVSTRETVTEWMTFPNSKSCTLSWNQTSIPKKFQKGRPSQIHPFQFQVKSRVKNSKDSHTHPGFPSIIIQKFPKRVSKENHETSYPYAKPSNFCRW